MDTHLHKETLVRQGKPEDDLKGHKLLPQPLYVWIFLHHISATLAWFSSLLCKQTKPSFPRGLPRFNEALTGGANVEGTLERGGDLFPPLSRQGQQEEQQIEGKGWEEGKQVKSLEDFLTEFVHSLELHRAPHCCSSTKPSQTYCSCSTLFCHLNSKKFVAMGCDDFHPILWMASKWGLREVC